jgi:4-hydroxyphenylpyruvate dioxygenase
MCHRERRVDLYAQGDIRFLLNRDPTSRSAAFEAAHGPCISALGLRVVDDRVAKRVAVSRGAVAADEVDYAVRGEPIPAVRGIGESLIYFTPAWGEVLWEAMGGGFAGPSFRH